MRSCGAFADNSLLDPPELRLVLVVVDERLHGELRNERRALVAASDVSLLPFLGCHFQLSKVFSNWRCHSALSSRGMVLWSNGEDNLPDVLCCEIFGFLDPTAVSISRCELASRELYEVSCSMRTMWKWMLGKSYGLWVDDDCDARAVHRYVTKLYSPYRAVSWQHYSSDELIDCSVIFSDDGEWTACLTGCPADSTTRRYPVPPIPARVRDA